MEILPFVSIPGENTARKFIRARIPRDFKMCIDLCTSLYMEPRFVSMDMANVVTAQFFIDGRLPLAM